MIAHDDYVDVLTDIITDARTPTFNVTDTFCITSKTTADLEFVIVFDHKNKRAYFMQQPDYVCTATASAAVENYEQIELTVDSDFISKLTAILRGEDYDDRVVVEVDLSDDELLQICRLAHEADVTINNYISNILLNSIEKDVALALTRLK